MTSMKALLINSFKHLFCAYTVSQGYQTY